MWRVSGEKGPEGPVGVDHSEAGAVALLDEAVAVPGPRDGDEATSGWRRALERLGHRAAEPSSVAERLVPPMPDGPKVTPRRVPPSPVLLTLGVRLPDALWSWLCRWSGWLGPIAVAVFAGVLRFSGLDTPRSLIFDETYYAKDAYSLWEAGYETSWPDDSNGKILSPQQSIPFRPDPAYIVHPPVGKWIIGIGEQLFGMNPFGWRFAMAVLGTLSVLMIARIGRRLFRSTLLGCVAGLLLAVDGLHFVMSRSALLDLVVMFWCLAAFGFLLLDRDRTRGLLARRIERGDLPSGEWFSLGWRPYRLAAGVCLGLTLGTKWSGLVILFSFFLLGLCWDYGTRKTIGTKAPLAGAFWDGLIWGPALLVISIAVYLSSWTGWFLSDRGYGRDWAGGRAGLSPDSVGGLKMPFQFDMSWMPESLRSLWHYHATMWDFHTHLTSPHTYQSNPWSWLLVGRPVSFFYESPKQGQSGCKVSECASEVLGIGTPLLWWAGIAAILYCLYRWLVRRDWRAGAILCALAAGYLPWFMYQERTIFLFYAVVFVPYLVLAVTMMLGALIGPATASRDRRLIGGTAAGVIVLLVMWNFLYFLPIFTGQTIPMEDWRGRMWFNTWI
ncbi:dolichyl-phosphate-mannose--protein mannosyltransferase [Kitasatospora sp. NPDC096147]|uniref:dolichyl-phosphate-mannose--protein mannosyltransferase n=1 Tax=Kitasatospora sp. NPDC096147 TaxID=3364093 RepID=UPI003823B17D